MNALTRNHLEAELDKNNAAWDVLQALKTRRIREAGSDEERAAVYEAINPLQEAILGKVEELLFLIAGKQKADVEQVTAEGGAVIITGLFGNRAAS